MKKADLRAAIERSPFRCPCCQSAFAFESLLSGIHPEVAAAMGVLRRHIDDGLLEIVSAEEMLESFAEGRGRYGGKMCEDPEKGEKT